jgi:hypothetical protein
MTLLRHQERLLRRADRALSRSDPELASMLPFFARITADQKMPGWEQLRPPLTRTRRVLLRPGFCRLRSCLRRGPGSQCRDGMQRGIQALRPAAPGSDGGQPARCSPEPATPMTDR